MKDRFVITDRDSEAKIELSGAFKTSDSDEFGELLMNAVMKYQSTVLDMKNTDYICSGVLREMLTCQAAIDAFNDEITDSSATKEMILINVNDEIMQVFEMTGFNNILIIE